MALSPQDQQVLLGLIVRYPLDVLLERASQLYLRFYSLEEADRKKRVTEILSKAIRDLRAIV